MEPSKVPMSSDEEESSEPEWRGDLPRRQSTQAADSLALGKERARGLGSCGGHLLTAESRGKLNAEQNL